MWLLAINRPTDGVGVICDPILGILELPSDVGLGSAIEPRSYGLESAQRRHPDCPTRTSNIRLRPPTFVRVFQNF